MTEYTPNPSVNEVLRQKLQSKYLYWDMRDVITDMTDRINILKQEVMAIE